MTHKFHRLFKFLDWKLDVKKHQLLMNYEIENIGKVTEILSFPAFIAADNLNLKSSINAACDLIHFMCGVSYYKVGLASEIQFKNNFPSQQMETFIKKTWLNGLAELAFDNNVSIKNQINFNTRINDAQFQFRALTENNSPMLLSSQASLKSLVALGGGKDSLVTIEELKQQGKNISLFMVGESALIKDVANYIGMPLIQVKRKIDAKLIEYNKTGKGFNGHVPITAINSCIAILTALLFDCDEVVFSNERSAESANTINAEGDFVNHQYSKSLEFEQDFSNILAQEIAQSVHYYSQQRAFSELAILKKFCNYPQYFSVFSSCNRNFHIDGSKNENTKWCCDCPKCRFVFLGLAPFLTKQQLLEIFKHNMLDDKVQGQGFAELLGLSGFKPFECVGEIEESQLAFNLIKDNDHWQEDVLIKKFKDLCPPTSDEQQQHIMQTCLP